MERIKRNVDSIKKHVGVPIMMMVKADGYGHGICKVAHYVESAVDAFGVETLQEGLKLKRAGIKKAILVLALSGSEIETACKNGLTIGLHNEAQLCKIVNLIEQKHIKPTDFDVQFKVDSGMHRLGFDESALKMALQKAERVKLNVSGVYSHLRDDTDYQKDEFDRLAGIVKSYYPQAKKHLASSHSLSNPNLRYDMVRLGIKAYEGAMSAYSQVIESRSLKAGERVSYGDYALEKDTNTAVIFGGYADGIARENPSSVYIQGKKCNVIGNVCMDCFVVDTGDFIAKFGDEVVLFDENTINRVACERNTIEYTVMTSLKGRIKRIYV